MFVEPELFSKTGSRYKKATLGQLVAATVKELHAAGHDSLAFSFNEQVIATLSELPVSAMDVRLITKHVTQELRGHIDNSLLEVESNS